MNENYGGLIKGLAGAIFVIEAIAASVFGISLMVSGGEIMFLGLGVWLAGLFFSFVSYAILVGFGQLVENSGIIAEAYKRKNEAYKKTTIEKNVRKLKQQKKAASEKRNDSILDNSKNTNLDDDDFIDITCPYCNADLSFPKEQIQSEETLTCPLCEASFSLI